MKENTKQHIDWFTFEVYKTFSAEELLELLNTIKSRLSNCQLYVYNLEVANKCFSEILSHKDIVETIFNAQLLSTQVDWGWIFGFMEFENKNIIQLTETKKLIKASTFTIQLADSSTLVFASTNQEIARCVSECFSETSLKKCRYEDIGFFEL